MKKIALVTITLCTIFSVGYGQTDARIKALTDSFRILKEIMMADPHRPSYHIVAPEGHAMPFDPNGAIYWNSKYHLGYIYQKIRNGQYEHVWGHLVSSDLLHWTQLPDMITVKDGDIEKGIFSGGTFISKEGVPHLTYHGEGSSTNLIALSHHPDLEVWEKFKGNPVLSTPVPPDPMAGKYRAWDPEVWFDREAGNYYMISGGRPAALFKSKDMLKWDYLGDFVNSKENKQKDFEDISCPDFFNIGNKQMLLFISHYLGAQYYIGTFRNNKFTAEKYGRMNWPGGTFFAPEQLVDNKGRNIIWGWIMERKPHHLKDFGWSGIMSLPRVLTLSKDGELKITPAKELQSLRTNLYSNSKMSLHGNEEKVLPVKGKSVEIQLELKGSNKDAYGVKVFCSPDGREETVIKYDPVEKQLIVDFIKSSVNGPVRMVNYCIDYSGPENKPRGTVTQQRVPFDLKNGENLKLNIFIDHSVIEIFANDRQCITQVVYPELPESNSIKLFTQGHAITASNIKVWEMAKTNPY